MKSDIVQIQKAIAPELTERVVLRHSILRHVFFAQPVGRRGLASRIGNTERRIRREVDVLRDAGLLVVGDDGIRLSNRGETILWELKDYVRLLTGMSELEDLLRRRFNLDLVIVIPGDSDTDEGAKKEMARAGARLIRDLIRDGDIIAVTGGTTMSRIAEEIQPFSVKKDVTVVPARGGLGEQMETQADTVAAAIAKKLGGNYRLLNLPEDLSEESMASVLAEPRTRQVLGEIRRARLVVHGIGTAEGMARRRGLSEEEVKIIRSFGAVGEAFGFYFNSQGEVTHITSSLGLRISDLKSCEKVIAIGGGSHKSEAVIAVLRNGFADTLITDEGASRAIQATIG